MKAPLVGEFLGLPLNQTPNLYLLDVLEKLKQTNKKNTNVQTPSNLSLGYLP